MSFFFFFLRLIL